MMISKEVLILLDLFLKYYGPMRLAHSLSHGIASASFSGKSPYFWIVSLEFDKWQVEHVILLSILILGQ